LAGKFLSSGSNDKDIKAAEKIVSGFDDQKKAHADYYIKYMKAVVKNGKDFVEKEQKRLEGLIESAGINPAKLDEFVVRKNIISKFK